MFLRMSTRDVLQATTLTITENVLAIGKAPQYEDVIALHSIKKVEDMSSSEVISHGELWRETADGLLAVHTEREGYNGGRSYCFQIVGPVQLGRQRPTGSVASARISKVQSIKGSKSTTGSSRAFCTLDVAAETLQWEPAQKELTCKDGRKIKLAVYGEVEKTRLPTDTSTAALKSRRIRQWTNSMVENLMLVLPDNSLRTCSAASAAFVKISGDVCAREQTVIQGGKTHQNIGEPECVCADPTLCAGALQLGKLSNRHSNFDRSQLCRECSGGGNEFPSS